MCAVVGASLGFGVCVCPIVCVCARIGVGFVGALLLSGISKQSGRF